MMAFSRSKIFGVILTVLVTEHRQVYGFTAKNANDVSGGSLEARCDPGPQPCNGILNTFCDDSRQCVCKPGFILKEDHCIAVENTASHGATSLGHYCETTSDCSSLSPGLICASNRCQCAENYFTEFNRCIPVLGSRCNESAVDSCPGLQNAVCSEGVCVCSQGHFPEFDFCKLAPEYGLLSYCHGESSPCGGIPNTKCQDSLCHCLAGYLPIFHRCYPGIGQNCSQAFACAQTNSYCSAQGKCQCRNGFFERNGECIPGIGSPCFSGSSLHTSLRDSGCYHFPNSYCNGSAVCDCKPGFHQVAGDCVRKNNTKSVEENCVSDADCVSSVAVCVDGQCGCTEGYVEFYGLCFAGKGSPCQKDAEAESEKICGEKGSKCITGVCSVPELTDHENQENNESNK